MSLIVNCAFRKVVSTLIIVSGQFLQPELKMCSLASSNKSHMYIRQNATD